MINIDAPARDIAAWIQVAIDQRNRNLDRLKIMWGGDSAAVAAGLAEIDRMKTVVSQAIRAAANEPLKK